MKTNPPSVPSEPSTILQPHLALIQKKKKNPSMMLIPSGHGFFHIQLLLEVEPTSCFQPSDEVRVWVYIYPQVTIFPRHSNALKGRYSQTLNTYLFQTASQEVFAWMSRDLYCNSGWLDISKRKNGKLPQLEIEIPSTFTIPIPSMGLAYFPT